mmetsp:Transcript_21017/g.49745  ORF Transcript_21017/g.49745 Transcript_21017/m.49745 type:complete len:254 (+) Transcript_21017:1015-1776(+)
MSIPECPPIRPLTVMRIGTEAAAGSSCTTGSRTMLFPPPAHPIVTEPHSSESRLSMTLDLSIDASKSYAPVKPVSSSTVKRHSRGGKATSEPASINARHAAAPIPLSAPSVVPSALIHAPSRMSLMGSFQKSCCTPSLASVTISTCACTRTGGADSPPPEPGLYTTRFPTASCFHSNPSSSAKSLMVCRTFSSPFEGRGCALRVAKFRHRLSGSRPSRAGGHVVAKEEAAFMRRDVCEAAFAAAGGTDTATKA